MGCGGRSSGCVRTFYDSKLSVKGAVAAAARAPRTTATEFMSVRFLILFSLLIPLVGCPPSAGRVV